MIDIIQIEGRLPIPGTALEILPDAVRSGRKIIEFKSLSPADFGTAFGAQQFGRYLNYVSNIGDLRYSFNAVREGVQVGGTGPIVNALYSKFSNV